MFKLTLISLACVQALLIPTMVYAEDETDGVEATSFSLAEMVVTIRKREEVLQEVPIAITSFSSQLIQDADLQDIEDIALMTPGFTYTPLFGGNVGNPVIRGANTTIGEPNVGFFIDGVYQSSRSSMEALFGDDIERVEVAKGPQSALYGRNTFAGAINYITKQSSNESNGELEFTVGNEGRQDVHFYHGGAITEDILFYRVSAAHTGFDGFYDNELTGNHLDKKQSNIFSLSLVALPTDNLEVAFRVGVEDTNDGDDPLQFVANNAGAFSTGDLVSLNNGFAVTPGGNERDNITTSLRIDWDLDHVIFTSITGYNDLEIESAVDSDYQAAALTYSVSETDQDEFSQEFRLTSIEQTIRWMAGVYFYYLDKDLSVTDTISLANVTSEESTRNWALFGSLGFDLTDQLALTVSSRYAYERKELQTQPSGFNGSQVFNHFTPKIALDYKLTNNALIYGSVAKAVKSGGFNPTVTVGFNPTAEERAYDEEKSLNYEVGLKSSWLDNRLTTNLAVFYIEWEDQIVRSLGNNFALINDNVGESSSQGFEFELAAKPAKNWDVSLGLAYTDAQYDDYTFDALAAFFGVNPVLDGNPAQFVSDWTANASAQYVMPNAIAGFDWKTRTDILYQDEQPVQAFDDVPYIPARTIINVRTSLENSQYTVTLWAKNLFDSDESLSGLILRNPANGQFEPLTQGPTERTFGATASVKF